MPGIVLNCKSIMRTHDLLVAEQGWKCCDTHCNLGQICSFSSASPLMSKSSVVAAWPEQALHQRFTSVNTLSDWEPKVGRKSGTAKALRDAPILSIQHLSSLWTHYAGNSLQMMILKRKISLLLHFILLMRFAHWDRSRSTISHSTHGISMPHFGNMHLFDVYGVRHVRAIG